ncbi:ABC transporter substrate-binding protein [Sutcliffiella horikoshii]|uniref:ABC transporter substrate-binding protein n=1 Tax=Sutcliffiella horikoshii TaxID=79883 RepID=UPI001CFEEE6C|nr:ABC transporter substrate-binding protein [Sutcliffiella horikoshii]
MKKYYYFQMRAFVQTNITGNIAFFHQQELAELWICSKRNVKRRLENYEKEGVLSYFPARGRGNKSKIIFHSSFRTELEAYVESLIKKNDYQPLIQLLTLPLPDQWGSEFLNRLKSEFNLGGNEDVLKTFITRKLTTLNPEQDELEPHLAHHWEIASNYTEWTLYLRKGVRFHDGCYLTSEDVKSTFEKFLSGHSPFRWLMEGVQRMECLSPLVIKITLKYPNSFFLRYLSSPNLIIFPKNYQFSEEKWVTTGAFRLTEVSGGKVTLEAFKDYFQMRPHLEKVEIFIPEFKRGNHLSYQISNQDSHENTIENLENGFRYLAFNFKKNSLFNDKMYRKAMYHALDVERMNEDIMQKPVKLATGFFINSSNSPGRRCFSEAVSAITLSKYQGETLTLLCLDKEDYVQEAKWIQSRLKELGVRVNLKTFTLMEYYSNTIEEADMLLMGEVFSQDKHLSLISSFLTKEQIFQRYLSDGQLEYIKGFIQEIIGSKSPENRESIIKRMEQFILSEYIYLFMYHPMKSKSFHPLLNEVEEDAYGFINFKKVWLKE